MTGVDPIAEKAFELRGYDDPVVARIFAAVRGDGAWFARIEISGPIEYQSRAGGESSLQALVLGIATLSAVLYASDAYKRGDLGSYGEFGGHLGIPAPTSYHDFAPYPF
jgi:hypothetical protein